ncbi:hypothetical protein MmiAt1_10030 [Methanimicrococcus sp. At1]|uniref:Uncharacterized protein n=1 Tax=Methanimicrococcus hacksteinii TaxID=3028293 RepID=A0ABU3VPU2_9EURY|nr:DUF2953 domain-containing protein [Methanimicrococcus sp. At1]MDV0445425.1 hypothetical protein [Methanimicrococcus sp. At1]
MTLQTALIAAGHYLLIAAGLILLLLAILLAAAFLLTFLMRFFADISLKTVNGKIQYQILLRLKIWFYEIILLDSDDSDEESAPEACGSEPGSNEKNTYHVTFTDEKISVQTTETKRHGSDYEIIVHTEETVSKDIRISDGGVQTDIEMPDIVTTTDDVLTLTEDEAENLKIEDGTVEKTETVTTEYEFDKTSDAESKNNFDNEDEFEKESENKFSNESDDESGDEFDDVSGDESTGLSDSLDEIKRYVDLSDPGQFVSDSMTAAVQISKATARLMSDLLLRTDIDEMSADIVFGLSDPADTALAFGAIHSFNASLYAYLADAEENSRSSKKRKKAGEICAVLRDDIRIVPDLTNKKFETDAEMSFSFWIPRLYIPVLRFLLNKNSRQVIRRYLYPYFIRHSLRTWRTERKQRKAEKKRSKKSSSSNEIGGAHI